MAGGRNFNPADSGYVEVNKRIEAFYEKYPEGSIQSEITTLTDNLVVVKAFAYRSPNDALPGIGHSQMMIPGSTSFTKDSEIENAETSAWGRAIAALGFEVKKSVASANEVRNKSTNDATQAQPSQATTASKARRDEITALAEKLGVEKSELKVLKERVTDKATPAQFTDADVDAMLKAVEEAGKAKAATGGEIV